MTQPDLFNTQTFPVFQGATYEPKFDQERLGGQMRKVYALMRDGNWRTLREIADCVGGSEAGVSARLRDLRKIAFGSHVVERERVGDSGLFRYRMAGGVK